MKFTGVVIEESLMDNSILQMLDIVKTEAEPVTEEHETPNLSQWTLHTFKTDEQSAPMLAEQFSQALEDSGEHGHWYVDFKNDTKHYVVFPHKVFCVDRSKPEQYKQVAEYGLGLGIPHHQLDFSPDIATWLRH